MVDTTLAESTAEIRRHVLDACARAFDRIQRLARTIADLESVQTLPEVTSNDYASAVSAAVNAPVLSRRISEAIGYRNLDGHDYGTTY
ncbi:MAG: hypothetical protein J1F16_08075 [Muribaculaceae bacterium]|nr:hypothetical protein [Muribaculaceae bacterium]